jgi:hypothetical protein
VRVQRIPPITVWPVFDRKIPKKIFLRADHWRRQNGGYSKGICEDRTIMLMQSAKEIDPAAQERISQLFARAWRRVQQRTGRSWDKKRSRWLQLLGAGGHEVSPNQLRVALNNLVSFAQLTPPDTALLRDAIHENYRAMQKLALDSLGRNSETNARPH